MLFNSFRYINLYNSLLTLFWLVSFLVSSGVSHHTVHLVCKRLRFQISRSICVDIHRCTDVCMSHHILYHFDVHALLTHPRSKCMPKRMTTKVWKHCRIFLIWVFFNNLQVTIPNDTANRFIQGTLMLYCISISKASFTKSSIGIFRLLAGVFVLLIAKYEPFFSPGFTIR